MEGPVSTCGVGRLELIEQTGQSHVGVADDVEDVAIEHARAILVRNAPDEAAVAQLEKMGALLAELAADG